MNEHSSFYRKITYLVLIAVLLFPISQLGAPSTLEEDDGGRLAQLRKKYELGQADLGEIDPASETIRMATLGLRGIAVSLLWSKANEYKKKEDWTNFRATLSQLAKLQPYFISFWRFQAWNLTYNVSVELDDVRDRFHYVKRGIEFLKEGTKYNRYSPYLLSDLGWFLGNKIGKADEKDQYRRMFKLDDDFHEKFSDGNPPPRELRDNWLVSRRLYEESVSAVDDKKRSLGKKNPTTFFADPAMAQINYGEAIEREGTFGEKAKQTWATAARLWENYGKREMISSKGIPIQLESLERVQTEIEELQEKLEALVPTAKEELVAERRATLTPEQQAILDRPASNFSPEEYDLYSEAHSKIDIQPLELAEFIATKYPDLAAEARKYANRLTEQRVVLFLVQNNRDVSNYDYWETRCDFEQTSNALKAHELAYAAATAFKKQADLIAAKDLYEQSFDLWAKVLQEFPSLNDDSTTGSDLMEFVDEYSAVLEQLDLSLADPEVDEKFPLWEVVEASDAERKYADAIDSHHRRLDSDSAGGEDSDQNASATDPVREALSDSPQEKQPDLLLPDLQ